jgi:hypothetical protein
VNFVLPVLLLVLVSTGCSTDQLPPIDKPDQLVRDCDALLAGTSIDSANLPDSIRVLNPVAVDRGENYIMITTFAHEGAGARGYVVSRQANLQIAHYKLTASAYPNIFRFELLP